MSAIHLLTALSGCFQMNYLCWIITHLAATQYNLNGIKSIELYPNPTTGNFTVEVEFYKSQRAALVVQDMLANTYVLEEYDESFIITQDIYLDGTVIDGTYVLKVVSEFDSASITFILAR